MNKKESKTSKKTFFKGFAIGTVLCGFIALVLLIMLLFFM